MEEKEQRIYIVSKCLLGVRCKYSGGDNYNPAVAQFLCGRRYVAVCPEQDGGLPTPREPVEIVGARVLTRSGKDVTDFFNRGAACALAAAREIGANCAILKANSPSCGSQHVYDGSFSEKLVEGCGVTAALLKSHDIVILDENDLLFSGLESK